MFVELIDQLRCPAPHEESWLVLFADESRDRHIIRGTLGCPICGTRYRIEGGTVWFDTAAAGPGAGVGTTQSASPGGGFQPTVPGAPTAGAQSPTPAPLPTAAVAAFLDLAEPGGIVALFGAWGSTAADLGDILERVETLVIAPDRTMTPMQSAIMPPARSQVPLAAGSMRAAAVDACDDAAMVVIEASRLVRSGGRILAPASASIPMGVRELTRNDHWWIGEREQGSVSGMIPLASRRTRDGSSE